jgi:hypothetical protein
MNKSSVMDQTAHLMLFRPPMSDNKNGCRMHWRIRNHSDKQRLKPCLNGLQQRNGGQASKRFIGLFIDPVLRH